MKRQTPVYRVSRMTEAQERQIQVGKKYRLGMYVATSTKKNAVKELMGWQEEEIGSKVKYTWHLLDNPKRLPASYQNQRRLGLPRRA